MGREAEETKARGHRAAHPQDYDDVGSPEFILLLRKIGRHGRKRAGCRLPSGTSLEEEASRLGVIADGKYPMFEYGTICLFHNDHSEWGRVRCQETYKA